jgi:ribonuclease HI
MVRVIQLNLGRRQEVSDGLCRDLELGEFQLALIQEPPSNLSGRITGVWGKVIYAKRRGITPRSCIILSNEFLKTNRCQLLSNFSDKDHTTIHVSLMDLHGRATQVIFSSIYCPGYRENRNNSVSLIMKDLTEHCLHKHIPLVMSMDSNSHHPIWGDKNLDDRGQNLLDFISSNSLSIMNTGNKPTFVSLNATQASSVIDLTLVSVNSTHLIQNWRVSDNNYNSDHKSIVFEVKLKSHIAAPVYNKRSTNWKLFSEKLETKLIGRDWVIESTHQLEECSSALSTILNETFYECCSLNRRPKHFAKRWVNREIERRSKNVNRLLRRAQKTKRPEHWEAFRRENKIHKKESKKAKIRNWRAFTQEISSIKEASRLQKILETGSKPCIASLKKPDGSYTTTLEETLDLLVQTHFPDCIELEREMDLLTVNNLIRDSPFLEKSKQCFTDNKVKWALNSFNAFKSPGEDGIFPIILQKSTSQIFCIVRDLFIASASLSHIPKSWRGTLVSFIPKADKDDLDEAKSYRPISLMSFTLKAMEKIVNRQLNETALKENPINKFQHAYQKGKSTDSALHEMLTTIECALYSRRGGPKFCLSTFIDISGAFDYTRTDVIIKYMNDRRMDRWLVSWIESSLRSRQVRAQNGDNLKAFRPTRGTPQGGITSPMLWLLVSESLIERLTRSNYKVTAFADDFAISVLGKDEGKCYREMNIALEIVKSWCEENGLSVNPLKSTVVKFTSKRKLDGGTVLLNNVQIEEKDCVKYLGVYLDKKLLMNEHIKQTKTRAFRALAALRLCTGPTWGSSPVIVRWIYEQVIRPRILYGSLFIWNKVERNKTQRNQLNTLQYKALKMVTGALIHSHKEGLEVVLNITPIDKMIKAKALDTCMRLLQSKAWYVNNNHKCHSMIELELTYLREEEETDKIETAWRFNNTFSTHINSRKKWREGTYSINRAIRLWTDGSVRDGKTGSGIFCPQLKVREYWRLGNHNTIMQAEVFAIKKAAGSVKNSRLRDRNIIIMSDSQASILALKAYEITSSIVRDCVDLLNEISEHNNVQIHWCPSHSNIYGNDEADRLASEATQKQEIDFSLPRSAQSQPNFIKDWLDSEFRNSWRRCQEGAHTKAFLEIPNAKFSKELMRVSRNEIRVVTGLITGHGHLNYHMDKLRLRVGPNCRFCTSEPETTIHLLSSCPSLTLIQIRYKIFGKGLLNQHDLKAISVKNLLRFARESGIYDQFFPT